MESNITQTPNAIPTNAIRTIGTDTECASLPFNNLRAINNSRFTPVNFIPDKIKANLRNKRTRALSFQYDTVIPLYFFMIENIKPMYGKKPEERGLHRL